MNRTFSILTLVAALLGGFQAAAARPSGDGVSEATTVDECGECRNNKIQGLASQLSRQEVKRFADWIDNGKGAPPALDGSGTAIKEKSGGG